MKNTFSFTSLLLIICLNLFSQTELPIIRAKSLNVDILDRMLKKSAWKIVPDYRPDIYTTNNLSDSIVFYTDIDSIAFKVRPDEVFNFVILVNEKDSAFTQIKYKKGNLDVLKVAWEYNFEDNRPLNSYTYNSPNSYDLLLLKNKFNIDSIAGNGDETSKIINLLKWVNHSFKYDGTKNAPSHENIADLMTKCINNGGTLHCGAMSWVLTDCYLAIGLKARQVVCFPKDSNDFECHSVVAVYSNTMAKWILMDPTNCAYTMNDHNEILSFDELRANIISGKVIRLNHEANINGERIIADYYLYDYMAKNMYAFQCFSDIQDNSVSNVLLPVEYKDDFSHTIQNHPKITNNPNVFWKIP